MNDDKLVGTHPRDELLVLRQDNLGRKKVKERKESLANAFNKYNSKLDQFAKKFLADANARLTPKQREELAKIYASRCKKFVGLYLGFWLTFLASNIFLSAIGFGLPLWLFLTNFIFALSLVCSGTILLEDKIPFLRAKKIIKTASEEEIRTLEKNPPKQQLYADSMWEAW